MGEDEPIDQNPDHIQSQNWPSSRKFLLFVLRVSHLWNFHRSSLLNSHKGSSLLHLWKNSKRPRTLLTLLKSPSIRQLEGGGRWGNSLQQHRTSVNPQGKGDSEKSSNCFRHADQHKYCPR